MKFQPNAEKGAVRVRLVDGSLTKFVDKAVEQELHIGTGLTQETFQEGRTSSSAQDDHLDAQGGGYGQAK
jgi:hypothetical protein